MTENLWFGAIFISGYILCTILCGLLEVYFWRKITQDKWSPVPKGKRKVIPYYQPPKSASGAFFAGFINALIMISPIQLIAYINNTLKFRRYNQQLVGQNSQKT